MTSDVVRLDRDGRGVGEVDVAPGGHRTQLEAVRATGGSLADVAEALLQQCPGATVKAEPDLAALLVARGARAGRRARVLRLAVGHDRADAPVPGAAVVPYEGGRLEELAHLALSAYGADGHPDRVADLEQARQALAGTLGDGRLGPLAPCSLLAVDGRGRPVAAAVVTLRPGRPPLSGPWLTHLVRDPHPRWAGLGGALLVRVLSRAATQGEAHVTLAVTEGNDAARLYERLGAQDVATLVWTTLPAAAGPPTGGTLSA